MMQKTVISYWKRTIVLAVVLFAGYFLSAQQPDSLIKVIPEETVVVTTEKNKKDTVIKKHSPRTAAIRSAILPGLGQIYNKKYWKLPIVYGAIGISGGVFFYNLKNYKDTRFAYKVKYNMRQPNATAADSALFSKIRPNLAAIERRISPVLQGPVSTGC